MLKIKYAFLPAHFHRWYSMLFRAHIRNDGIIIHGDNLTGPEGAASSILSFLQSQQMHRELRLQQIDFVFGSFSLYTNKS